jgi:UDP-GlcNAc:undecaprenyl-phosphate GlcNAc-1-phosphate transferase
LSLLSFCFFLGYVLTALLVGGSQRDAVEIPLVAWAMVMALPLLDTLLVMARRIRYGCSPFSPDRTHLHHRLMALGLAHPGVVAVMYAAMASFGVLALAMQGLPEWYLFATLCLTGVIMFGGVSWLQHCGFSFNKAKRKRSYATLRQWPWFRRATRLVKSGALPVSVLLLFLLCLPAVFFTPPELSRGEALALLLLGGAVVFYSLLSGHAYRGMLHGAVYVSIFALFFMYNLANGGHSALANAYLPLISVLAAIWVVIKIAFRQSAVILKTSSFELLMLFLSWFLPFVLFEAMRLPEQVIEAGRLACLQVLPFMLVAKIFFNLQPQGNKWVVGALAGTMVIIALRGSL